MEDAGPDTPVATIGFARYRAVEAGAGTVLFSKCEGWQKEVQAYMQKIERDYFNPSILSHSLKTYDVVTNLDHLSKDLRDAVQMPTFMHRDGLIPDPLTSPTEYGCDPVALKGQIVYRDYDASPRYANHGLFLHVEGVPSSGENRDIAKLLDIRDNGTSRAHYYPQFKYKGDFNALYEQWKKAEHWPEDTGKQQTRLCTEILKRDFPTLAQWVLLPKKRRQVLSKPPKTGHGIKH